VDTAIRARAAWQSWVLLAVGVLAASVSAILIRYADDAEPLAISFWRCAAGSALLLPFARRRVRALPRAQARLPLIAGIFLALHFATWITSLELTTVAASVLLVSTTPIFVAVAAWWLFKERQTTTMWIGIGVALAGTTLIALAQEGGDESLLGNLLALAGGAAAGGYVLAGRAARRALGILEYAVVTYAVAAVLLVVACAAGSVPLWGYDAETWWAITAIVAGPQLLGHTTINLVLDDIDPTTVSVTIMAEPVIATALAYMLFDEVPSLLVYPGGVAILIGIYMVTVMRRTPAVILE
jgi:drug/metabolite transporter (DMT)-like permease